MKESINKLTSKLTPVIDWLRRYKMFLFFMALVFVYGFLVVKINNLSSKEPSEDEVTTKLETVPRPRIDQIAVDKINELQDNSSQVEALFNEARKNPFNE